MFFFSRGLSLSDMFTNRYHKRLIKMWRVIHKKYINESSCYFGVEYDAIDYFYYYPIDANHCFLVYGGVQKSLLIQRDGKIVEEIQNIDDEFKFNHEE